ncbi:hypothetical protein E8E12_001666 [Didymella heteroderae]|uniref:Uncharacterized protein n=1 Tax=Didymella heteroderae TaxID=1769908 RepID=A0A9P4WU46_9PLEO|nr:hypothetical protein E8E12_001666 [Didymella heteroderae]
MPRNATQTIPTDQLPTASTTTYYSIGLVKTIVLTPAPSATTTDLTTTIYDVTTLTSGSNLTSTVYTRTVTVNDIPVSTKTYTTTVNETVSTAATITVPALAGYTPLGAQLSSASARFITESDDDWAVQDEYWDKDAGFVAQDIICNRGWYATGMSCYFTVYTADFSSTATVRRDIPAQTLTRTRYVKRESATRTVWASPTSPSIAGAQKPTISTELTVTSRWATYEEATTVTSTATLQVHPSTVTAHAGCAPDNLINALTIRQYDDSVHVYPLDRLRVSTHDPVLEHFKHDHAGNLRDTRNHFANAIRDVKLPFSLQQVQLDFINDIDEAINEQRRSQPDLVYPRSHDPFSSSLRLLSANLRKMEIRVMADKSLFWPHDSSTAPSWPNLESLNVMFHIRSPSGSWYFQGPPGELKRDKGDYFQEHPTYPPLDDGDSDEEWHYASAEHPRRNLPTFRVVPINDMMEPFLESFAKAAANMPRLKDALLWAPLEFHPDDGEGEESDDEDEDVENDETEAEDNDERVDELTETIDPIAIALYPDDALAWGIAYVAPGGLAFDMGQDNSPSRQLWWRVGQWRPSKELHELFQKIGEAQASNALKEFWTDSQYGDGLVAREWFSGESFFRSVGKKYPAYF